MGAVVGVDPSIASTGLVVLSEFAQTFHRVQTAERGNTIGERLERMRESVVQTLDRLAVGGVDLVVIESPAFGKNNGSTHMLAGHWWLMAHALEKFAPVAQVGTGTLKKFATGNGRAEKKEVHAAARGVFPTGVPRSLAAGNDIADASVLAAMGMTHLGREFGGVFASSGLDSVLAVRWPSLRGTNK